MGARITMGGNERWRKDVRAHDALARTLSLVQSHWPFCALNLIKRVLKCWAANLSRCMFIICWTKTREAGGGGRNTR
jgi:hypothetical protein